jgi:hypothetical protein
MNRGLKPISVLARKHEMTQQAGLRACAIGTWSLAALGVAMIAPALGIYANLPLIGASARKATPAVFLAALRKGTAVCHIPGGIVTMSVEV